MSCSLLLLSLSSVLLWSQSALDEIFDQGNEAYNNGEFQQALLFYNQIIEQGKHSPELFFNMANSYYRLNMVAEANFYYEKAKLLDPVNEDILTNSEFAQNMTLDTIVPLRVSPVQQLLSNYFRLFSIDMWAYMAVIIGWGMLIVFVWFLWTKRPAQKKLLFGGFCFFLLLWSLSSVTTYHLNNYKKNRAFAIIFSEQIEIYSEPNQRSEIQFYLHEGTKVELIESLQQWQNIRLANGASGWVNNAELKMIE
ncbi:MAG: tetratricopeptide repeat protein [Flavobacteriaceae bacterium]|nr:tetratricopeptide repeat protein [Flavobacteriaceae bacterium]MCY4268025.1 tetratricopeptide repeat protein [Flavobacteriaceae bacterium]